VLEHCWDQVDYISAHRYSRKDRDDTATFLAEGVVIDEMLVHYRGLLDYVRAIKRGFHRVHVSFDEWNVWYREVGSDGGWAEAPHLLEEHYNLEDALVCAQYLNAFIRHADIVKVACIAQVVNVIAPVLTRPGGVLVQSIYWPFKLLRDTAVGEALRAVVKAPEYATRRGDVPVLDVAATFDPDTGTGSASIVNRDPSEPIHVVVHVADRRIGAAEAEILSGDPTATNTWESPDVVAPVRAEVDVDGEGSVRLELPGPAHAVIRFRAG
jgi:alpha-N-arabinofuranosidase